jgi:hypothetical protein
MRYLRLPVSADRLPDTSELHIVTSWVLQRVRDEGPVLLHESGSRGNNALVACAALIKRGESVIRASRQVKRAHGRQLTESQLHLLEHFAWQTGAGPDSV